MYVAKLKALISYAVTEQLIYACFHLSMQTAGFLMMQLM